MVGAAARTGRLEGRAALVTGAGGSIGRGIARCLAEEGASLALADISPEDADTCREELEAAGAKAVALPLDVTDADDCEATVARSREELGGLDILVNNAGVIGGPDFKLGLPLSDITSEDWDAAYEVNVKGVFHLCRAALPGMQEAEWGRIVNISSRAGRQGTEAIAHYSASKAAVINFTQALAREAARDGITANAVCPGLIWSPLWRKLAPLYGEKIPHLKGMTPREVFDYFVGLTPLGREQTPEDIGRVAAFLASEDACTITGQAILVDSGAVMG